MSLMNAQYPDIANLLLDEIVPGKALALVFHVTLMGPTGRPALEVLERIREDEAGPYVLVVEGAIPTARGGGFGHVGGVPMTDRVRALGRNARAVVALGTCASYGGVPGSGGNPTGCVGVKSFLEGEGIGVPVVNVPGCPPHPAWFVETVAHLLLFGLPRPGDLDEVGRLRSVYQGLIHENCPRRGDFDVGRFARAFGEPGCLYELGCKGPYTDARCPAHRWNGGVNWCIGAGHPCLGCCEPEFPDRLAPVYRKFDSQTARDTYRRARCAPWWLTPSPASRVTSGSSSASKTE
jgi:hydrogenase small subunit